MSKQEKLAALIDTVRTYSEPTGLIRLAFEEYASAPDEPPPKPEMPECVRALVEWFAENPVSAMPVQTKLESIRDHYAKPLKLEVGKVYEDRSGQKHKAVYVDANRMPYPFLCVRLSDGVTRWHAGDGAERSGVKTHDIIREVSQ